MSGAQLGRILAKQHEQLALIRRVFGKSEKSLGQFNVVGARRCGLGRLDAFGEEAVEC
jgi:hypothetical protein